MTTQMLYSHAASRGYAVMSVNLPLLGSVSAGTGHGYIGIDCNLRGREEKTRLAHEVGHCETGTYYVRHMPNICRRRNETRADRWAYEHVLPFDDIQAALDMGNRETWELAEHFEVTNEFMVGALRYYTETRGMRFSAEKYE